MHYANDAKLIFGWLKKPALEVRVKDIDGYIQHSQGSGHKVSTINRQLATLRVFYDWLSFELDTPVTHPVIPRRHFIFRAVLYEGWPCVALAPHLLRFGVPYGKRGKDGRADGG
jgi:hypothetical protein